MKDTGLKDSYNNPIHEGDTIQWIFMEHGINFNGDFLPSFPGEILRESTKEQVIKYEVREYAAGYFLDKPNGCGVMMTADTIKCKVIRTWI